MPLESQNEEKDYEKIFSELFEQMKDFWAKEAYQEGLEEGREIGIKQSKEIVAKKCLRQGLTIEEISKITELSIEQITTIKQEPKISSNN